MGEWMGARPLLIPAFEKAPSPPLLSKLLLSPPLLLLLLLLLPLPLLLLPRPMRSPQSAMPMPSLPCD